MITKIISSAVRGHITPDDNSAYTPQITEDGCRILIHKLLFRKKPPITTKNINNKWMITVSCVRKR
jgi:hypothetical protein